MWRTHLSDGKKHMAHQKRPLGRLWLLTLSLPQPTYHCLPCVYKRVCVCVCVSLCVNLWTNECASSRRIATASCDGCKRGERRVALNDASFTLCQTDCLTRPNGCQSHFGLTHPCQKEREWDRERKHTCSAGTCELASTDKPLTLHLMSTQATHSQFMRKCVCVCVATSAGKRCAMVQKVDTVNESISSVPYCSCCHMHSRFVCLYVFFFKGNVWYTAI